MWKSDCSFATTWWDVCVCLYVQSNFHFFSTLLAGGAIVTCKTLPTICSWKLFARWSPIQKPPRSLLAELLKVWSGAHFAGGKAVVRTEKCPHKVRKVWEENYIASMLEIIRKLCEEGSLATFKRSIFFLFHFKYEKTLFKTKALQQQ